MIENKTTTSKKRQIDYSKIYHDLLKYKRLYYIVISVAFALAAIIMLPVPNYYTCSIKLSPELSNRSSSTSSLASLASSFGVQLGSAIGGGSEALFPTLYPDLMASVDFKASLFNIKVKPQGSTQEMTYYEYVKDYQKGPWWGKITSSIWSVFSKNSNEGVEEFNPRHLTKKQDEMAKSIESAVACQVDMKTMVITLSVTDVDPIVCTTMADSTMALLQKYITDYRTSKARVDLEYNKKLLVETKRNYERASRAYAAYADANLHTFQEKISQKKAELETEVSVQRSVYQQVTAQLQQAQMKLQEDTPAFAVIQASTVPVRKSGPKRSRTCILFMLIAFMGTTFYALYKEDDYKMIFGI